MSDNEGSTGFDAIDLSRRLSNAVEESRAVCERLQAIMKGADSTLVSSVIEKGLKDYALMFKGVARSHKKSIARISRIQELSNCVPMDRIAKIPELRMAEDPVHLIKGTLAMQYIDVNFSAANKFVELITNGSLLLLTAQVQNIAKANGIILGIGGRKFTPLGYINALALDIGGIFAPIVSQVRYIRDTLLRSEKRVLIGAAREASSTGKAFRFSEFTALANSTTDAHATVFESAEHLLADFVTTKLPMALDELGV